MLLLLSLSFAALLPILDFQGRLGAALGGLVAALRSGAATASRTVLAAKAGAQRWWLGWAAAAKRGR